MIRTALAGTAVLLVATSVALAAPPPGSSLQDRRIYYAEQAIDKASKQVQSDRACRFQRAEGVPVEGAPSAQMLNTLAPLRRPARSGEDLDSLRRFLPFELSVYRDYVRVLTAADGSSVRVFPLRDASIGKPRPRRCVAELRSRVKQAIADRPAAFKRVARRLLRDRIADIWLPRQREGLLVIGGGRGEITTLTYFRQRGALGVSTGTGGGNFSGLVPDGVATIDITFRRFETKGYWSKHHPVTLRTTATVKDNAVSVAAPNTLRDAVLNDQVWRAADGRVIRVISG
jgi:hypothetical protein